MKNLTLFLVCMIAAVVFNSCHSGEVKENKPAAAVLNPNDSLFMVNEGGYQFQIILPKDMMIASTPSIKMNEATGDLHIQCGEQFWIVATLEKTDIPAIKTAIGEDMLFTSKIVEETNNSILYQRMLPDGALYDYNFRSVQEIAGKSYSFRTSEEGEFSMESVNRMKQAIGSIQQSV